MKRLIYIIFLIPILFVFDCRKKNELNPRWTLDLPETKNPINLFQWAYVKVQNPKLRLEAVENSEIINYLKYGSIIKVLKKSPDIIFLDNQFDYWYLIDYEGEKGWVFGSYIEIFNTYEESVKNCEEMLFKDLK